MSQETELYLLTFYELIIQGVSKYSELQSDPLSMLLKISYTGDPRVSEQHKNHI